MFGQVNLYRVMLESGALLTIKAADPQRAARTAQVWTRGVSVVCVERFSGGVV